MIVWSVGDSLFGTEVAAVAGVIPFAGCARVPTREASCLGVIGRGGRFYSVIGMRRLLGAASAGSMAGEAAADGGQPGHLLLLRGAAPQSCARGRSTGCLGRFDFTGRRRGSGA